MSGFYDDLLSKMLKPKERITEYTQQPYIQPPVYQQPPVYKQQTQMPTGQSNLKHVSGAINYYKVEEPKVNRPMTLEEYRDKLRERKRVSEYKSKKMLFN